LLALALLAGSAMAQSLPHQLPRGANTPTIPIAPTAPHACAPNPAIESVTVTPRTPGESALQISYEIVNRSDSEWSSSAPATVTLTVVNDDGRYGPYVYRQTLPARTAARAQMLTFTSPMIEHAVDYGPDFFGTVNVEISYTGAASAGTCGADARDDDNRL